MKNALIRALNGYNNNKCDDMMFSCTDGYNKAIFLLMRHQYERRSANTNSKEFATSVDSDQPAHPLFDNKAK